MKEEKVAIFIPTYNAAQTLPMVIDRIPAEIKTKVKDIFVIDNDSKDNTYLVGVGYKKKTGLSNLKIFKNEKNLGYGGSQKKAYQYAIDHEMDYVVMLHGDAQYAPEMIPALLSGIKKENADMIFGSRMNGDPLAGGMPLIKFFGNRCLTAIENAVLKLKLSEYHSGYRIYSCRALQQVPFPLCSDNYDFDTDILIQFKIKGLKIVELPIPTHYGEESHNPSVIDLTKYSINILKTLGRYLLHIKKLRIVDKFQIPEEGGILPPYK